MGGEDKPCVADDTVKKRAEKLLALAVPLGKKSPDSLGPDVDLLDFTLHLSLPPPSPLDFSRLCLHRWG